MKLSIVFVYILLAVGTSFGQNEKRDYSLLWEITTPKGEKSFVFGSLHSNDRRLFDLPDSVYYALDISEMVVLETDIFSIFEEFDALRYQADLQFDSEGKPYTTNTRASRTPYGDENGMPQFLDAYFQQYCHNAGKEFFPLETVDFQVNTFTDVLEVTSFEEGDYEALLSSKDDMIALYLDGDIEGMNEFVKSGLSFMPDSYQSLIVDRNIGMVSKLEEQMEEHVLFCAIGAGHLAGPQGVLNLLRKKGYGVRKVTATFSDTPLEEEISVRSFRSYELIDPDLRLSLAFPGKPVEVELEGEGLLHCMYLDLGQGNTYQVQVYNRGSIASWEDAAANYLPSPEESPYDKIELPNGGEAIQGLAQEYWDNSMSWTRVLLTEDFVVVLKASGGNKFMNSPRAFRFFETLKMY